MARHYLPAAAFVVIFSFFGNYCLSEDTGDATIDAPPGEVAAADAPGNVEPADAATISAAPASTPVADATPVPGSLYERLGGTAKVTAVVGEAIDKVASNRRTSRSFDKVDIAHVKEQFVQQLCSLTGGGCTYTGATMQDVNGGQGVRSAEFYQLTEALRAAMRSYEIPLSARNELLSVLASIKPRS